MIALYGHNGSDNHGCEAIVRSTKKILGLSCELFSGNPDMDYKYGIDKVCVVKKQGKEIEFGSARHIVYKIVSIITQNVNLYTKRNYSSLLSIEGTDNLFISIGGDNYCYYHMPETLRFLNKKLCKKGKTILWGCSIEPEVLKNRKVVNDLKSYNLITVREHITGNILEKYGVKDNVVYVSDPAFTLDSEKWELPKLFNQRKVIGINVSPMIYKYGNKEKIINNVKLLLDWILKETDCGIALVPHVVCSGNSDLDVLEMFYTDYMINDRVILLEDMDCMKLKYLISKCELFVGARTHATIAAYSTCIPTMVIGYSVKSRGIAEDIFGGRFDDNNHVVSVQDLHKDDEMIEVFASMWYKRDVIKSYLEQFMPDYIQRAYVGREAVRGLNYENE